MKKTMVFVALWALTSGVKAQFNFEPVTQLLNDSIGVIGQAGQNCGFMIVQGDSIIYEKYLGSWDSQTYQPIASGSKILSMALMMRLIDEGYLHPNDTVQNFIPSFGGKPFMTLHQLMSHTSGLPGQSQYISDNSYTLQQAVDSIGLKTPMTAFAPGYGLSVWWSQHACCRENGRDSNRCELGQSFSTKNCVTVRYDSY